MAAKVLLGPVTLRPTASPLAGRVNRLFSVNSHQSPRCPTSFRYKILTSNSVHKHQFSTTTATQSLLPVFQYRDLIQTPSPSPRPSKFRQSYNFEQGLVKRDKFRVSVRIHPTSAARVYTTDTKAQVMAYTSEKDISYVENGHESRHLLDVNVPKEGSGPFPAVIYIHGGAFKMGAKDSDLVPFRLIEKGYAVVPINYRLSGNAIFPAAVQDCKAAVRFIRKNAAKYNINPDKLVTMGESAGAYMSMMVGITGNIKVDKFDTVTKTDDREPEDTNYIGVSSDEVSSEVLGAIDYYGPCDFRQMDDHAPSHAFLKHNPADSPESLFIGKHIVTAVDECKEASPLSYLHDNVAPLLICHGTRDCIVPFHQGTLIGSALIEKGQDVTFHPVVGADHVWRDITPEQQKMLDHVTDAFLLRLFGC